MAGNYFSIERNDKCWVPIVLIGEDKEVAFKDVMNMTYDEIVAYEDIESFVFAAMHASNEIDDGVSTETYVTLIDEEDNSFIWSVVIGPSEDVDRLMYNFIDWRNGENRFKYVEE